MTSERKTQYPAKIIHESTKSFIRFGKEIEHSEMLMCFFEVSQTFITENQTLAKERLYNLYDFLVEEKQMEVKEILDKQHSIFLNWNYHKKHLGKLIYIRTIDNFVTYFKEILQEVVIKKPQILKSKETEDLEFILSHESMDSLIKGISDKKIEELFYKGINDIDKFFNTRLGVKIFKDKEEEKVINLLIKQRNLSVHARGRISKSFAKELDFEEGKILEYDLEYVSRINTILYNFLVEMDKEISQKFQLEIVKFNN